MISHKMAASGWFPATDFFKNRRYSKKKQKKNEIKIDLRTIFTPVLCTKAKNLLTAQLWSQIHYECPKWEVKKMTFYPDVSFSIIRCGLASLYEGVSICMSFRPSIHPTVCPPVRYQTGKTARTHRITRLGLTENSFLSIWNSSWVIASVVGWH